MKKTTKIAYTEQEHRHRYASWCASTAASRSPLCRFKVKQGKELIGQSGLQKWGENWSKLPSKKTFDDEHKEMRDELVNNSKAIGIKGFTHGVAAKLINVYLKTIYQTSPCKLSPAEEGKKNALHPPVDDVLMQALIKKYKEEGNKGAEESWRGLRSARWSKFGSGQYEKAIKLVREETDELWKIEEYFKGYQ